MTIHQPFAQFAEQLRPVAATPLRRNRGARAFDLPPVIHLTLIGAYFTFMGVLATAFMGKDLVVPAAIFAIGIASLFVTPALWARVKGDDGLPKQSWSEFKEEGVDCLTGALTANQALAQIMVLPALMVTLAFFFAVLKASL